MRSTSTTVPEIAPPERRLADPPASGGTIGLGDAFAILKARWRFVALPTLAVCFASIVFVQVVTPRYTGEAKVLLESRDSSFTRPNQERADQTQMFDEQAVASQVQVAMSRDVAREAIRRLDLVGNPEFDPLVDGMGPVRRILMMVGLAPNLLDRPPEERILERYFDRVLVYPAGKSRILTIEFRSKDPELAARGANVVADVYLASLEAAKADTARSASTWLGGNIDGLRTKVAEAEAKVEAFRARSGLFSGGGQINLPISSQQLTELSTQLSQARTAQADSAAKAKLIKSLVKDGRNLEIPDVANNELIRRLSEQRITLRAQAALEARTLLPGHPRMKELNAQLTDLEAQIRAAADRVAKTLENDATIAGARVETLQAAVDAQKGVAARSNGSEVELRALEREAKAQRDQLESYLARYREASARDADKAVPADARIVSKAVVPELPSFPKKVPIVLLATLATFLFSSGFVVARHLLSSPDAEAQLPADAEVEDGFVGRPTNDRIPVERDAPAATEHADTGRAGPAGPPVQPAPRRAPVFAAVETALSAAAVAAVPSLATTKASAAPAPAAPASVSATAPRHHALSIDPARADDRYDLAALISRLEAAPSQEGAGRRVLVAGFGTGILDDLAPTLAEALSSRGRTLILALDGAAAGPGLTDLVAGEATFADVIAPHGTTGVHRVRVGEAHPKILLDEPQAVEITLDALDRTYDWIVCRLGDARAEEGRECVAMMASAMDAVVIASNAAGDEPGLVSLYEMATQAGAPVVMVAHDRAA